MFLSIQIDLIILKTYDKQFTLTTKKSLHIIFKVYVSLDTKQDILETFFPANLLVCTEETKPNTIKGNIHPEHKYKTQNKYKKLKPGFVTSYDLWSGYEACSILIAPRAHTGQFISSLQTITTLKKQQLSNCCDGQLWNRKSRLFSKSNIVGSFAVIGR